MGVIQKLGGQQYLKRFDNMSMQEKETYLERVRKWNGGDRSLLRPRMDDDASAYQNVIAAAAAWSDAEVKAWNEGATLVTALVGIIDAGWLPNNIYVKSAKRAIRFITKALDDINAQYAGVSRPRAGEKEPRVAYFGEGAADTSKVPGVMKDAMGKQAEAFVAAMEQEKTGNPQTREQWLARPKHLDQYIHLLPESTRAKAANIKALFMKLDEARENARMLMENPHGSADTRAHWMQKATAIDDKIRAIFKEVDEEWKKLVKSGGVVLDDFGNARVVETQPSGEPSGTVTTEPSGTATGAGEPRNVAQGEEEDTGESRSAAEDDGRQGSSESRSATGEGGQRTEPAGTLQGKDGSANEGPKKRGRKPLTEEEKAARREARETEKAAEKAEREAAKAEKAAEKATAKAAAKAAEDARQAGLIRKWLIDTRYANTKEHNKKWVKRYREMVKIGGEEAITEKVREAAEFYGIDLTSDE